MSKRNESIYPLTWSLVAPKDRGVEIIILDKNGEDGDAEGEYNHPDHIIYQRHWNDICETIIDNVEEVKDMGSEFFNLEGTIEYSGEYEDEEEYEEE